MGDLLAAARQEMYFKIAEFNDTFADLVLQNDGHDRIQLHDVVAALKEATLARKLAPVVCGSGLKSTQSVVPLLDMITHFLPSPLDRKFDIPDDIHTCGIVFKISHDKQRGQMSFVRMVITFHSTCLTCSLPVQGHVEFIETNRHQQRPSRRSSIRIQCQVICAIQR